MSTTTAKKCSRCVVKKSFDSAKSSQEMLKALKQMESCFEENELGVQLWKLAHQILMENGDPEQILSYGKRSLNVFIYNDNANLPCSGNTHSTPANHGAPFLIGCILYLLGFASYELKRYRESLSYFNWSVRNLEKLVDEDETCSSNCILNTLHETHREFMVKLAMGNREDAAPHKERILEIKKKYMEEGSLELGEAYKDIFESYIGIMHFRDALPFCLKALEIYLKHFGNESVEVAGIRRFAGVIYHSIGDDEKALEQNQLALRVLTSVDGNCEVSKVEMESGCMMLGLGRNEEAIDLLKSVISRNDLDEGGLAMVYITMAKAFSILKKFANAKKYMELGCKILERKDVNPIMVAGGFADVSEICKKMNDYETAISVTRKVLALPELSQQILLEASDRLFKLIDQSGKVRQGIPYMKDVVEKLKDKFGGEHCSVGYSCLKLAFGYQQIGSLESSVEHFLIAKEIFDVSLGLNHLDSLLTIQSAACIYADMGKFNQAIEYQEKVVEGLAGLGKSEEDKLKEAIGVLKEMKVRARGTDPKSNSHVVILKMER